MTSSPSLESLYLANYVQGGKRCGRQKYLNILDLRPGRLSATIGRVPQLRML
jgi:hypothetical protein